MAERWKFYVYALKDNDSVVYVGKGHGYRLATQRRHHHCDGHEMARFRREADALAFERKLIAELRPPRNKTKGGDGGRYGMRMSEKARTPEMLIESRIHTAEYLLSKDLRGYLSPSEIDGIRQLAEGLRNGTRT